MVGLPLMSSLHMKILKMLEFVAFKHKKRMYGGVFFIFLTSSRRWSCFFFWQKSVSQSVKSLTDDAMTLQKLHSNGRGRGRFLPQNS